VFLHIKGLGGSSKAILTTAGVSERVCASVMSLLEALTQRAAYRYFNGKQAGTEVPLALVCSPDQLVQLQVTYESYMARAITHRSEETTYERLASRLLLIAKEDDKSIVDVTSIRKRYLADLIMASLAAGINELWTFDALRPIDFDRPWRGLIHELDPGQPGSYEYVNILGTAIFRELSTTVLRVTPQRTQTPPEVGSSLAQHHTRIFVSYSKKDRSWLDRLQVHLRPLEHRGAIDIWDDTRVGPGMERRKEIENALSLASVAILLISADFLASESIHNRELPQLLEKARQGGTRLFNLIVGPCLYMRVEELARYQTVNDAAHPLDTLPTHEAESVLLRLAQLVASLQPAV